MLGVDTATLAAGTAVGDPPAVDVGRVNAAVEDGHACDVEDGHGDAEREMTGFCGIPEDAVAAAPPAEWEIAEAVPPLVQVLPRPYALLHAHL